MQRMKSIVLMLIAGLLLFTTACSKKDVTAYMTSKEHFEYAMKFYKKKDYTKAQEQFTVITYKYSGSDVADDAQFYLAESYYFEKDFVLAASEYDRLISSYPRSEFVETAMYQLAICYYKLSPGYALDQKFTYEALSSIQNFMDLYPKSAKKAEVDSLYQLVHMKLARKEFENAQTYRKVSEYESAIAYYDFVINNYYETEYTPLSMYWKGYCYYRIKQFEKAKLTLQKITELYPLEKDLVSDALDLFDDIKKAESKQKTVSSSGKE
jgi:outer membrane protein assembly factor BamD